MRAVGGYGFGDGAAFHGPGAVGMYELADWGQPVAPEWSEPQEKLAARLPTNLVRILRTRAGAEGISVSVLVHRLLTEAMGLDSRPHWREPAAHAPDW